jgi:hypothetical protein
MATNAPPDVRRTTAGRSALTRWARRAYLLSAGLFVGGVVLQVFFAGLGVLVHPRYVGLHVTWGHTIQWLPLVLLLTGGIGRLPRRQQALNVLLLGVFALQYVFLGSLAQVLGPTVRALHAVNALTLFWLSVQLTRWAWNDRRSGPRAA